VEDDIANGEANPYSISAFFQFVLNGDDPAFLAISEKYLNFDDDIDLINKYEKLPDKERKDFQTRIENCMNNFLKDNESVLSSTINLFSDKFDFVIKYDQGFSRDNQMHFKVKRSSMFGGRSSYLLSPGHLDEVRYNDDIIMCEYGGLFKFQKFNFLTYPKKAFLNRLKLKPLNGNPFILCNEDSGAMISFQRINLHSKEKIRTPYYRMSHIDQWVMNDLCESGIKNEFKKRLIKSFRINSAEFENN
jgi:hypothetical protein